MTTADDFARLARAINDALEAQRPQWVALSHQFAEAGRAIDAKIDAGLDRT